MQGGGFSVKKLNERSTYIELLEALQKGRFTPFLGAGASSLRPNRLDPTLSPWLEIISNMQLIRSYLMTPTEERFLLSFAAQRLKSEETQLKPLNSSMPNGRKSGAVRSWPPKQFVELQVLLIKLAAVLGTIFGEFFAGSNHCAINAAECALSIPTRILRRAKVIELLERSVRAAAKLSSLGSLSGPLPAALQGPAFAADSVYTKLLHLTFELIDKSVWRQGRFQAWHKEHERAPGSALVDIGKIRERDVVLRLDHLAWLSDLIWYTLSFWSPHFPTTSELAFRLSLVGYMTPPRQAELAQAAEAMFDDDKLLEEVEALFAFYDKANRPSEFHLLLAAALYETYRVYRRQHDRLFLGKANPGALARENEPPALALAFTTNFDRSLENAFDAIGLEYHVIFPVASGSRVAWKFRTHYRVDARVRDFPEKGDCLAGRADENDSPFLNEDGILAERGGKLVRVPFVGPVIVKLHGSPLESLESHERHWIVLSESGYLEALLQRGAAFPDWIEKQLQPAPGTPRSLWFLGYSIADWNIKLQLYEHARHGFIRDEGETEEEKGRQPPVKSALDRKEDSFRCSIFRRLTIQLCVGDLGDLPRALRDGLREIARSDSLSPQVRNLLGFTEAA